MLEEILAIAMMLSGGHAEDRARVALTAAQTVVNEVDAGEYYPKISEDEAKKKLLKLLVAWSYWESSWRYKVVGDNGKSCGIMQAMPTSSGMSCDKLRSSPEDGFRGGLIVLHKSMEMCKNLESALGAYATGKCNGVKKTIQKRCRMIGGC